MKKRKLNWVAIGNAIGLIASLLLIIDTIVKIVIKPFFTKQLVALTPFGLILLIIAFMVCNSNFNYFNERITRTKNH